MTNKTLAAVGTLLVLVLVLALVLVLVSEQRRDPTDMQRQTWFRNAGVRVVVWNKHRRIVAQRLSSLGSRRDEGEQQFPGLFKRKQTTVHRESFLFSFGPLDLYFLEKSDQRHGETEGSMVDKVTEGDDRVGNSVGQGHGGHGH